MGGHVSFGADNTLITPCGIFNILNKQVNPLESLFYNVRVRCTLFSGDGTRVARVFGNQEIEDLTIHGVSILKRSFEDILDLEIKAFSYSGSKLIVSYTSCTFDVLYVDIQENEVFEVQQPYEYNDSFRRFGHHTSVAFTRDERNEVVLSENSLFIYPLENVDGSSVTAINTPRYLSSDCFSNHILIAQGTISDIIIYIDYTGKIVEKMLGSALDISNDLPEDLDTSTQVSD